jgi:hypothetical protein
LGQSEIPGGGIFWEGTRPSLTLLVEELDCNRRPGARLMALPFFGAAVHQVENLFNWRTMIGLPDNEIVPLFMTWGPAPTQFKGLDARGLGELILVNGP